MNKWFSRAILVVLVILGGFFGYWDACVMIPEIVDMDCTLKEAFLYSFISPFLVAAWVLWDKWGFRR